MPTPTLPTSTQISQGAPTTGTSGKTDVLNTCLTLLTNAWASLGALAYKATVAISDIAATGTASSTTFLRGDGTWATPPSGGGGAVSSVFGRSGSVLAASGDYSAVQVSETRATTNYTAASGTVEGHFAGIDSALGTLAAGGGGGGGTGLTVTAVQTSAYTASVNQYVRTDTTSGSLTVTLPSAPSDGAEIAVADSAAATSWGAHPVSIAPNGKTIGGSGSTVTVAVPGGRVSLRYTATGGNWTMVQEVPGVPLQVANNLGEALVDQTAINNVLTGVTVPRHFFTEQTAKTANYTLATTDSGTQIPMNVSAGGIVTVPTYSSSYKGFACDIYAVTATTVNGTTSGSLSLATGESAHVRARNGGWRVARVSDTALT